MKTIQLFVLIVAAMVMMACSLVSLDRDTKRVDPSDVIITEERSVAGFTGIDFSAFGKVIITQGDNESLTITGSDNVVPLILTTVKGKTLTIRSEEDINYIGINAENVLTFKITVKDLNQLTNSGAGQITMDQLTTDSLDINISGAGGLSLAGEADTVKIDISGAGSVIAPDFKIATAEVIISGLGTAEVWVTDRLTGNISGAGSIRYYGEPQVNTEKSGIGGYEALGNK